MDDKRTKRWAIAPLILVLALLAPGATMNAQTVTHYRLGECGRLGVAFRGEESLRVQALIPDGPAHRAGLRPGDVVVRIGDREANPDVLEELADTLKPGTRVHMIVRRGDETGEVVVAAMRDLCLVPHEVETTFPTTEMLEVRARMLREHQVWVERPINVLEPDARMVIPAKEGPRVTVRAFDIGLRAIAGAEFSELDPLLAQYFEGVAEGLLTLRVAPRTPADRAGLLPGDVVVRAGDEPIREIARFRALVARSGDEPFPIEIVRKGETLELRLFDR